MDIKDIAQDGLDLDFFDSLLDIAEQANGDLAVTADGQLVVYGSRVDVVGLVADQPFTEHTVTALGEHVLGFSF